MKNLILFCIFIFGFIGFTIIMNILAIDELLLRVLNLDVDDNLKNKIEYNNFKILND